jgi:hypothetical protein
MRLFHLTCLLVLSALLAGNTRGQSSVDSTLHVVESLYASGSYSVAELEARRFLENDLLSDSVRVVAEQWVGFSLVAQGKTALAKEHFIAILRRRPSHELDPVLTSPKILSVFTEARMAYRAEQLLHKDAPMVHLDTVAHPVTFRAIAFPGWEQWHDGRTTVGAIFAGAGIATLGGGIALEFLRSAARKEYLAATLRGDIDSKYQTYNRYARAEVYAFVAFALVYLASEVDVFTANSPVSVSAVVTDPSTSGSVLALRFSIR